MTLVSLCLSPSKFTRAGTVVDYRVVTANKKRRLILSLG